jgi:hypothetical protein
MKLLPFIMLAAVGAVAQNCGPNGDDEICPPGECCSFWGWCGVIPHSFPSFFTNLLRCGKSTTHCGTGCLKEYSGPGSPCSIVLRPFLPLLRHATKTTEDHHQTHQTHHISLRSPHHRYLRPAGGKKMSRRRTWGILLSLLCIPPPPCV